MSGNYLHPIHFQAIHPQKQLPLVNLTLAKLKEQGSLLYHVKQSQMLCLRRRL